ncbi:Sorting nexin-24 [Chelonia mydas]|uniref:Sorting nexin-24 n=1 Tax=Chelonia mydas TaxID=8469 RepID=M7BRR8_CHEMY|nr:Sorting nexin-24 [Chelonia mydas]
MVALLSGALLLQTLGIPLVVELFSSLSSSSPNPTLWSLVSVEGEYDALKRFIRTPEIPSKHVRNWVPKVLEQRRQGLEIYLQGERG